MLISDEAALWQAAYDNLADVQAWICIHDWYLDHGEDLKAAGVRKIRESLCRLAAEAFARLPVAALLDPVTGEPIQRFMPRALMIAEFADEAAHGVVVP